MRRTRIGCGVVKRSRPCSTTRTNEPAGIDGRGFEMSNSNNEKALSGTRAERGFLPLSPALIRPENEVSQRVPVLSQRKYANRKHETAYWKGFRRFVPSVPVVPVQNARGGKKITATAARVVGAAGVVLRLKRAKAVAGGQCKRVLLSHLHCGSFSPRESRRPQICNIVKW